MPTKNLPRILPRFRSPSCKPTHFFAYVVALFFIAIHSPDALALDDMVSYQAPQFVESSEVLRSADIVQTQMFAEIEKSIEAPIITPNYPKGALLKWLYSRHEEAVKGEQSKQTLQIVGEELRLAQSLLQEKEIQRKRAGLRVAHIVSSFVISTLKDKQLNAQIYEGFLIPHLAVAYQERWQDLSRQRILEGAVAAFSNNEEIEKKIVVLRSLLAVDDKKHNVDQNTRDWARASLAQVLASQGNYSEAISLLKSITSPSILGMKKLIPKYEELQNKQKSSNSQEK